MSILNVEHLTHGFGDRVILDDVSFRLLKGEHIGLVGANGEGKSTFLNIVTGKLMPDEGKVEWAKNVRVGYLDQHSTLTAGMTIESVLKSAFSWLFALEEKMNQICDALGEADESQMDAMMEELGVIQDTLTMHDFYTIDAKVEEVARALGLLELGLHHDVTDLSGGQRMKVLLAKLLLEKPDILLLDEPTNYLDAEHIAWLTRYLQEYENAFILISHDIPFLNDVVNIIYHMDRSTVYIQQNIITIVLILMNHVCFPFCSVLYIQYFLCFHVVSMTKKKQRREPLLTHSLKNSSYLLCSQV